MSDLEKAPEFLTGQLLIAMPGMTDPRFEKTVIYMCAHNEEGAMGLVVNKVLEGLTFPDLLSQLNIEPIGLGEEIRVHFGGPVETGRGFVLHSTDYAQPSTMAVDEQISLTATIDILRAIAEGDGPDNCMLALGYAGWGPGQLDSEILANGWLSTTADDAIVFDEDHDTKWQRAMTKIGIDPRMLSDTAGHA